MKTNEKYFQKNISNFYDPSLNRSFGYVVTEETARILAQRLDGKKPNLRDIPDEDIYNIFVGVNIWCNLFSDLTQKDPKVLLNRIMLTGLQASIAEADNHRLWLVSNGTRNVPSRFWLDYIDLTTIFGMSVTKCTHAQYGVAFSRALSLLGCLRRIRLSCLDYSFMIDDYLASNKKCGNFNCRSWIDYGELTDDEISIYRRAGSIIPRTMPDYDTFFSNNPSCSSRILDDLAEIIAQVLSNYERNYSLFTLPPGSTYEGANTYLEKFKIVEAESEWLARRGIDIRDYCSSPEKGTFRAPSFVNRYITVPKSYKVGRGVAPEPVSRQVLGYQVADGIKKCLRRVGVDLNDQSINQKACAEAFSRRLTTVDKSAASDSIALELVKALFKYCPDVLQDLLDCRTTEIFIKGKGTFDNHRAFTMGNSATFGTETLIFWALGGYCINLCELAAGEKATSLFELHKKYGLCAYGDDIIIPDFAYPTYVDLCQKLGFVINNDKTYTSNDLYRESCGVEFWKAPNWKKPVEVTGVYYPRGTSRKALPELLALQHKYYAYSAVNSFLTGLILDAFPEMTASEVTESDSPFDIWVDAPLCGQKFGFADKYAVFSDVYDCDFDYTVLKYNKLTHLTNEIRQHGGLVVVIKGDHGDCFNGTNHTERVIEEIEKEVALHRGSDLRNPKITHTHLYSDVTDAKYEEIIAEFGPQFCGEIHAIMTSSSSGRKVPKGEADRVERLMYLLTIGRGLEHINSSDYTEPEKEVHDRLDLLGDRKIEVTLTVRI